MAPPFVPLYGTSDSAQRSTTPGDGYPRTGASWDRRRAREGVRGHPGGVALRVGGSRANRAGGGRRGGGPRQGTFTLRWGRRDRVGGLGAGTGVTPPRTR